MLEKVMNKVRKVNENCAGCLSQKLEGERERVHASNALPTHYTHVSAAWPRKRQTGACQFSIKRKCAKQKPTHLGGQ